jgi:glycerophosphoryl diester phosphodiesterase
LPLLFEKWYLRWAPRKPFGLKELLEASAGRTRILLDLKSGGEAAARLVRKSIDAAAPDTPPVAASSQQWRILRAIHALAPEVDTFYSIDVQAKLDLFLSVIERDNQPRGVSCRHSLLREQVVERLHARGLWVLAWTVDDLDEAQKLAAWGVDGITTHKVADFREALLP